MSRYLKKMSNKEDGKKMLLRMIEMRMEKDKLAQRIFSRDR
jgi:hypothetical protein